MSPVHQSNSTVDTSGIALATTTSPDDDGAQQICLRDGQGPPEDLGIQRSLSMPPAMFAAEGTIAQSSRNRERSGYCIQRNQTSGRQLRHPMLESQSEEELTTRSVEQESVEHGGGSGGGGEGERMTGSYPRGRRNAFRVTRLTRRATCAADGSMSVPDVVARSAVISDRPG